MVAITLSLISILSLLSLLHVYWAFGGTIGVFAAIPERDGKPLFLPGPFLTFFVALGLAALAALAGLIHWPSIIAFEHSPYSLYAGWFVSVAFIARAVGDFKYVGFFKRVKNTRFAAMDSKYFAPLCIVLAGAFALLTNSAQHGH